MYSIKLSFLNVYKRLKTDLPYLSQPDSPNISEVTHHLYGKY